METLLAQLSAGILKWQNALGAQLKGILQKMQTAHEKEMEKMRNFVQQQKAATEQQFAAQVQNLRAELKNLEGRLQQPPPVKAVAVPPQVQIVAQNPPATPTPIVCMPSTTTCSTPAATTTATTAAVEQQGGDTKCQVCFAVVKHPHNCPGSRNFTSPSNRCMGGNPN